MNWPWMNHKVFQYIDIAKISFKYLHLKLWKYFVVWVSFHGNSHFCPFSCSSHSDHVFDVAWSPTAEFLVTASHDHLWKLWLPNSPLVGYIGSSKFSQVENLRVTQSIFPDNVTTWSIWHRKWSKPESFNFLICIDWNENIPVGVCMFIFILLLFVALFVSWQKMLESQLFVRENIFHLVKKENLTLTYLDCKVC